MKERDKLVLKAMHLAYLIHVETRHCVFIDFSGHVDTLNISVRESHDDWQTELFDVHRRLPTYTACKEAGDDGFTASVKSLIEVLETILQGHDIPYDDMECEEWLERRYSA